jgi:hypothetical protein
MPFELILSIALGVGLSAACGFRIFVPFMLMSIAARSGYLHLAPDFAWIGTYPALLTFSVATLLEVLAYYIPWVDNLLDTVAMPAAVVAGTVATASVITDMSPLMTWTLALIAGGGVAGLVQTGTTVLRGLSSVTTGGLGNFLVATGELFGALVTALLTLLFPLLAVLLIGLLLLFFWQRRMRQPTSITPTAG